MRNIVLTIVNLLPASYCIMCNVEFDRDNLDLYYVQYLYDCCVHVAIYSCSETGKSGAYVHKYLPTPTAHETLFDASCIRGIDSAKAISRRQTLNNRRSIT